MGGGNSHQRAVKKHVGIVSSPPPATTSTEVAKVEPKKPLTRATIEAYVSIIGGFGVTALTAMGFPINFYFGLGLWSIVVFCLVDLAWNSKFMISRSLRIKWLSSLVIMALTVFVVSTGWSNTHPRTFSLSSTPQSIVTAVPQPHAPPQNPLPGPGPGLSLYGNSKIENNGIGILNENPDSPIHIELHDDSAIQNNGIGMQNGTGNPPVKKKSGKTQH
jgi:hypothetical protein